MISEDNEEENTKNMRMKEKLVKKLNYAALAVGNFNLQKKMKKMKNGSIKVI